MIPIPKLLHHRELGLPGTHSQLEQFLKAKTLENIFKDNFSSELLELSNDWVYRISVSHNFIAILSTNKSRQAERILSLWSLIQKQILWDFDVEQSCPGFDADDSDVSDTGMVLVKTEKNNRKIVVIDGKLAGELPLLNWHSIIPLGNRILTYWSETHHREELDSNFMRQPADYFFEEWSPAGISRLQCPLQPKEIAWTVHVTCNQLYWVRLASKVVETECSLIEVVDRVSGVLRTIQLPFIQDMETFTCAYLSKNRLFFAKNNIHITEDSRLKINQCPTIYVYDLFANQLLGEFSTGENVGFPQKIVGNDNFVVWWENNNVKCLDQSQETITPIARCVSATSTPKIVLNLFENALMILFTEQFEDALEGTWNRKVIDLTNRIITADITYTKNSWGSCFLLTERMLLTDLYTGQPGMYVEDYENAHLSKRQLSFRNSPS